MEKINSFVALMTCFDADEEVNYRATRKQVARQIAQGNSIFCCGTNGEAVALTFSERIRVVESVLQEAGDGNKVIVNIGCPSSYETLALGRELIRLGVKSLAVVAPFYIACSQDGLLQHYRYLADKLSVPVYIYNIPSRTHNALAIETIAELAKHENIVGIKDTSGSLEVLDACLAISKQAPGQFAVFSGPDDLILYALRGGSVGCVSGFANLVPGWVRSIVSLFAEGKMDQAAALQQRLVDLRAAVSSLGGYVPAVMKRACSLLDPSIGRARRPADSVSDEQEQELRRILGRFDVEQTANIELSVTETR